MLDALISGPGAPYSPMRRLSWCVACGIYEAGRDCGRDNCPGRPDADDAEAIPAPPPREVEDE